jgi:hypothetical protein
MIASWVTKKEKQDPKKLWLIFPDPSKAFPKIEDSLSTLA